MDAPIIAWGGQGRDRTARTLTRGARRARCGLEGAKISAGRRSLARHFSEPAEGARGRRDGLIVVGWWWTIVSRGRSIVGRWTIVSRGRSIVGRWTIVSRGRNVVSRGRSVEPRAWCAAKAVA